MASHSSRAVSLSFCMHYALPETAAICRVPNKRVVLESLSSDF